MKVKIVFGTRGKNIYYVDDKEVTKDEFDKLCPNKIDDLLKANKPQATLMQSSKAWPIKSDSLGVHPSQCDEAEAHAKKVGVPTEFDRKTGQAIIRDNAHLRDFNKAHGYRNRDGGYGQVTG